MVVAVILDCFVAGVDFEEKGTNAIECVGLGGRIRVQCDGNTSGDMQANVIGMTRPS